MVKDYLRYAKYNIEARKEFEQIVQKAFLAGYNMGYEEGEMSCLQMGFDCGYETHEDEIRSKENGYIYHTNCTECYKESGACCRMDMADEDAKYGVSNEDFSDCEDDEDDED